MISVIGIDSDISFHNILRSMLPTEEFDLTLCLTEQDFISKIKTSKYDLALINLRIDKNPLKGLEIICLIRSEEDIEINKNIPIVVLSTNDTSKIIANAIEVGANDFLSKPLSSTDIVTKIQALVLGNQAFAKKIDFGNTPAENLKIILSVKYALVAITEIGFIIKGTSFVSKGAKVKLNSKRLKEIFDVEILEVYSTGFVTEESGIYLTSFEIDPDKRDLLTKAKIWIKSKKSP